jgi:hypothetical protein
METFKKYWWLFLLIPIGGYIVYVYYRSKKEVNEGLRKARQAKADYALAKEVDQEIEPLLNGTDTINKS